MLAFFRNDMGFGGNNGLTDFKDMLGFDLQADGTRAGAVRRLRAAAGRRLSALPLHRHLRLGRVLVAIRDAESRTRFLGYRVEHYKLFVFVVSAVMAGIAGALYVPQVGIINPGEFSPGNSIEIVIWVAIGGRGTLLRRDRSAPSWSTTLKTYFTGAIPELWLFALGGLFIAVTLFLPKGSDRADGPVPQGARRAGRRRSAKVRGGRRMTGHRPTPARSRTTPSSISTASRSASTASRRSTTSAFYVTGRRAARDHRPQRRRQDDDDGRGHRQDQARLPARSTSTAAST